MGLILRADTSLLLVIDIQEKLAPAMWNGDAVIANTYKLLQASSHLSVPQWASEQYPKGIGATVPLLQPLLEEAHKIEKMTFSCCDHEGFLADLTLTDKKQIVITGMETHVCVLQTALGLVEAGYDVFIVDDAVTSRTPENKMLGVERMRQHGVSIVSTEMVIFEWLQVAGTPDFKAMIPLIK